MYEWILGFYLLCIHQYQLPCLINRSIYFVRPRVRLQFQIEVSDVKTGVFFTNCPLKYIADHELQNFSSGGALINIKVNQERCVTRLRCYFDSEATNWKKNSLLMLQRREQPINSVNSFFKYSRLLKPNTTTIYISLNELTMASTWQKRTQITLFFS